MPDVHLGADFAGHRLEAVIGRGGMGVVYRARDLALDRVVALKLIAPEFAQDLDFRERFKRESKLAASIRHPNVISIYRAGEEADQLFITMDYVEGTDLKAMIVVRGRLDPTPAAGIVVQVASGLEAAHARGLVHRDVKPANVLLEDRRGGQHTYLTDFGLTKRAGSGSESLTKTGIVVGTTDYLAPEQLEGGPVDARVDVYALGCLLYEALTGQVPYPRETDAARMWAHMSEEAPSVLEQAPNVPAEFDAVVRRAMAKDRNERFVSAEDMGRAVVAAASTGPQATRQSRLPPLEEAAVTKASPKTPDAAQDGAPPDGPPPATPPPDAPPPERHGAAAAGRIPGGRRTLLGIGIAAAAAAAVAVVLVVASGGKDHAKTVSVAAPGAQAGPKWRPVHASSIARQQVGSAVLDGKIWVLGGLTGKSATAKVEGYDRATDTWTAAPDLPLPLHHSMAVSYKGELVVMGGWVPKGPNVTAVTSAKVFALRNGAWVPLPNLNRRRAAGVAAVVGDKIVLTGGQVGGKLVKPTEVFDGQSWRDVSDIPTPREHLAAASDGRYVYAVGGRVLSSSNNSAALERYDPALDRWSKLPDMPTPSGSLGAAIGRGHLVALGGETPTGVIGAVQSFDLKTNTWSALPPIRTPRHGLAVAVVGNSLYALDGARGPTHAQSTAQGEVLDLGAAYSVPQAVRPWRHVHNSPTPRQQVATAVANGRIWVFGGLTGTTSTAKVEGYDPAIDTWTAAPDLPLPLHHAMAATYRGELVVMGGWVPTGSDLTAVTSDKMFALRNGAWVPLPNLKRPRVAGGAAVAGGKLVVVGGQAGGGLVKTTEVFDGKGWKDVSDIPTPRDHLTAVSDGRYVYAVGGRALSADKNSGALERYDPAADQWAKLPDMPTPSGGLGAGIVQGHLVALGGETATGVIDAVQSFDLKTNTWSALPPMRTPRHGLAVGVIGNALYAFDGARAPGHAQSVAQAEVLDFK